MRACVGILAILGLGACSGGTGGMSTSGTGIAAGLARILPGSGNPATVPDAASLAATGQPLMLALIEATRATGSLAPLGTNGTHETWASPDGVGLTFDQGILFATRGLGADLLTAETAPLLAAWPAGSYTRTLRHLDGENRIVATRLSCTLADMGQTEIDVAGTQRLVRHAVETCAAGGFPDIRNDYWREAGIVRQSRQWVSPALGHVTLQRLVD